MTEILLPEVAEFYKVLPKVELHRHLEGSLRVPTMMEIVRAHEMDVKNTGYLRPLVQVDHDEPYTFENFLSKFGTLRLFYKSPDIIKRVSWEAVEDAALDNVRYMELRFTPAALSRAEGFPMTQVVNWVIESVHQAKTILEEEAEQLKQGDQQDKISSEDLKNIVSTVVADWCTEIRRALDFFYSTYPEDQITRIVLSGGGANIAEFRQLLGAAANREL